MKQYDVVIIGCGGAKQDTDLIGPLPAIDLYTGSLFKANRAAALAMVPRERVWILSALHGLIHADRPTAKYDMRLTWPGAVSAAAVHHQARLSGLLDARNVAVLAGSAYVDLARTVWPHLDTPALDLARRLFHGRTGLGHQISAARRIANTPKENTP